MPAGVDPVAAQATLAALRRDGAWRLDPARFCFLESLAGRLARQPEPVRRLLDERLRAGLSDYAQRWVQARQAAADEAAQVSARHPALARQARAALAAGDLLGLRRLVPPAQPGVVCEPLARLNEDLRRASAACGHEAAPGEAARPGELASVRRFRQVWSSQRAREQVAQAAARQPANAGPLNSHSLVLRSLSLMQSLAPQYLQRFLLQVESLQWLDKARDLVPASPTGKPRGARTARRNRAGK